MWGYPGQPPPRIQAARSPFPWLELRVLEPGRVVPDALVYEVRCVLTPPLPVGTVTGAITLEYDAYSGGTLSIPVAADVSDVGSTASRAAAIP